MKKIARQSEAWQWLGEQLDVLDQNRPREQAMYDGLCFLLYNYPLFRRQYSLHWALHKAVSSRTIAAMEKEMTKQAYWGESPYLEVRGRRRDAYGTRALFCFLMANSTS